MNWELIILDITRQTLHNAIYSRNKDIIQVSGHNFGQSESRMNQHKATFGIGISTFNCELHERTNE